MYLHKQMLEGKVCTIDECWGTHASHLDAYVPPLQNSVIEEIFILDYLSKNEKCD